MGTVFAKGNGFHDEEVIKFAGPEVFSFPIRFILQIVFKTGARKQFEKVASEWGDTERIDAKPWGNY